MIFIIVCISWNNKKCFSLYMSSSSSAHSYQFCHHAMYCLLSSLYILCGTVGIHKFFNNLGTTSKA